MFSGCLMVLLSFTICSSSLMFGLISGLRLDVNRFNKINALTIYSILQLHAVAFLKSYFK